jgi:hypothetical protein
MKNLFLLFTIICLFSCKEKQAEIFGNEFYFSSPQPINDSELNKFPNKFVGLYMDSDSLLLAITKELMFYESSRKFRIHNSDWDSIKTDFDFVNDKYILKNTNQVYEFKRNGDSLDFLSIQRDTFFTFSNDKKVKRINNNLIINQRDSTYWEIKIYTLKDDVLTVKQLYSDTDLRKMDSITKIKSKMIDSTTFLISPSKNEFNKFLKFNDFGYDRTFKKIN